MKVYYSDRYCAATHAWDTTRKSGNVATILRLNSRYKACIVVPPVPLTRDQITRAHDSHYVDAVETGDNLIMAESNGFKWCPYLYDAVRYSNGGVLAAARTALDEGVSGSLSSGLHHATRRFGGGFCTFNGLAIAAIDLLFHRDVRRVLIIDYDAHYGDGTADIIADYNGIDQIDVSSHDVRAITPDANDYGQLYLDIISKSLGGARIEQYDLVLYNAGMDPHEHCQIGGIPGVTAGVLYERDRMVFERCASKRVPVAFCLAGGYQSQRLTTTALATLHAETCFVAASFQNEYPGSMK